jgi:hypothetical protein
VIRELLFFLPNWQAFPNFDAANEIVSGIGREDFIRWDSFPVSRTAITKLIHRGKSRKNPSMKTKLRNSICRLLPIALALICFGLAPTVQAVGPDTDGAIPGSNNGEGIGVLVSLTNGIWNTGTGFEALNHLTSGNQNTATGLRALNSDTNGGFNTATGVLSLFSNTSGFFNSATGAYSLANNISGNYNTANGYAALYRNTADENTATGFAALYRNTTGEVNTANGVQTLFSNTSGSANTATGRQALYNNTDGSENTANGYQALFSNTNGNFNTANGYQALANNTNGIGNTANGYQALFSSTGLENTAYGASALLNNSTGSANTALGVFAGTGVTTASGVIAIGTSGANVGNSCFIGHIRGVTTANADAIPVLIDSAGQLGTVSSSRRFKKEIKSMDSASEAILALKPVTFHYKSDASGTPQFGLIAEEVAEVNPDLVVRDENGEIYTVRYDAVNAMLLNEFLKERRKVEEQRSKIEKQAATITELKSTAAKQEATVAELKRDFQSKLAVQENQIKALASGLEKVSAQLEVSRPAARAVANK